MRVRTSARRTALALVALVTMVVAVPLGAASADASSSPWKWTASVKVPHYKSAGSGNVSCPTERFCAAVDENRVVWSTHPTVGSSWTGYELEPLTSPYLIGGNVALRSIDCVSIDFCMVVDNMGQVFTTTTPMTGADSWTVRSLDDDQVAELTSVSCASATACVALAYSGAAFTLTPTGWQRSQVAPHEGAASFQVSCATTTLCAAVEADGYIYTIDPSIGGAWTSTKLGNPLGGWISIDCTAKQCIAVGNSKQNKGVVAVSSSPQTGAWKTSVIKGAGGGFEEVGCHSSGFCVIAGGHDWWTTKPSSSSKSWHRFDKPNSNSQTDVECLTSKECFVADIGNTLRLGHRK